MTGSLLAFDPAFLLNIFFALLAIMFMITVHELGHYIAGKLLGFKINEFSIGMGPKLFSKKVGAGKKKKETEVSQGAEKTDKEFYEKEAENLSRDTDTDEEIFSIRAIPLGGYCAFAGEDEEADTAGAEKPEKDGKHPDGMKRGAEKEKKVFNAQPPWKRIIVLFCGPFFNLVTCVLIAFMVFLCYGDNLPTIMNVYETSPNYSNGTIMEGDVIYAVNGKTVYLYNDAFTMINDAGEVMDLTVIRNGEKLQLKNVVKGEYTYTAEKLDENGNVMLDENGDPIMTEYKNIGLGVSISSPEVTRFGFFEAVGRSFGYTGRTSVYMVEVLADLVTGKISLDQVGGPITTIDITAQAIGANSMNIFFVIMLISVNLAVFNLLPIPALDGSRILFTLIEWIAGKPVVSRKVEGLIHFVGMLLLFGFVILVDVLRYI